MNRFDTYYQQIVTETQMDAMFDAAENADHYLAVDNGLFGVATGLGVGQHGAGDLTVDVAAGAGYDQQGQRIGVGSTQNVDVSQDYLGASTAVTNPGDEKYVSVFIKFKRIESDPKVDGHGTPLNYSLAEGYEFVVVAGADAVIPTATRPALLADGILLADIHLINAQVQVLTADIDMQTYATGRRQDIGLIRFVGNYTQQDGYGDWPAAVAALANILDQHFSFADYEHKDSEITSASLTGTPVAWTGASTMRTHAQQMLDGFNQRCALAWGRITAAGVITDGINIASITHPAVGGFVVNLTTAALAGYTVVACIEGVPGAPGGWMAMVNPITTSQFGIYISDYLGAAADVAFTFIVIAY